MKLGATILTSNSLRLELLHVTDLHTEIFNFFWNEFLFSPLEFHFELATMGLSVHTKNFGNFGFKWQIPENRAEIILAEK